MSIAENLIGASLKGFGVMGGLGALGFLVTAAIGEKQKISRRSKAKTIIPEGLLDYDVLVDQFLELGAVKNCDQNMLKRAANRCLTMVSMYKRVKDAHPSTVRAGLITDVCKVHTAFMEYLRAFYKNSNIPRAQTEHGCIPVAKDLAEAHKALVEVMDAYKHNVTNLISEKVRKAVEDRV
jgi:hypothetical protein